MYIYKRVIRNLHITFLTITNLKKKKNIKNFSCVSTKCAERLIDSSLTVSQISIVLENNAPQSLTTCSNAAMCLSTVENTTELR